MKRIIPLILFIPSLCFANPLTYQQLENKLKGYAFMESLEHDVNLTLLHELSSNDKEIHYLKMQLATDEMILANHNNGLACSHYINDLIQYEHDNYVCYKKGAGQ